MTDMMTDPATIDWQARALAAESKLEKAKALLGSIARQIGTLLGSDWLKEPLQDASALSTAEREESRDSAVRIALLCEMHHTAMRLRKYG